MQSKVKQPVYKYCKQTAPIQNISVFS